MNRYFTLSVYGITPYIKDFSYPGTLSFCDNLIWHTFLSLAILLKIFLHPHTEARIILACLLTIGRQSFLKITYLL